MPEWPKERFWLIGPFIDLATWAKVCTASQVTRDVDALNPGALTVGIGICRS